MSIDPARRINPRPSRTRKQTPTIVRRGIMALAYPLVKDSGEEIYPIASPGGGQIPLVNQGVIDQNRW
jgi:hypothetical protein